MVNYSSEHTLTLPAQEPIRMTGRTNELLRPILLQVRKYDQRKIISTADKTDLQRTVRG